VLVCNDVGHGDSVETSYTLTLTQEALDAHCSQSACFWSDPDTFLSARAEKSEYIIAGAKSLGINLPAGLVEQVAVRFDGMMPLDRYLEEPSARLAGFNCAVMASHIIEQNDYIHLSATSASLTDEQTDLSLAAVGQDMVAHAEATTFSGDHNSTS
jgi:hypothetical protein